MTTNAKFDPSANLHRRSFLGALAVAAPAAAGAVVGIAPAEAQDARSDRKKAARFKETEHVKTFYRVNRY